MATFTTNYNFALPIVGSDKNAWGQFLNTNWQTIDGVLKTTTDTANASLPRAGGTMTGFLVLNADPTALLHPVTKQYADAADTALSTRVTTAQTDATTALANAATAQTTADAKLPLAGGTITGALTVNANITTTGNISAVSGTTERQLTLGSSGGYFYGNATKAGWLKTGAGSFSIDAASGDLTASGNVIAYSDAKLKENIQPIREALTIVNRMRGVFYDRIDTGSPSVGVIAQEMQEVLPQVVHQSGDTLGVSYGNLTAVLIEAVKELSARLDAIEAR